MGDQFLDELINDAIIESFRNNFLNLYQGNVHNPNRIPQSRLQNTLSSRYYNTPPEGGYQINEEHEYNIDYDDMEALIFLDVTTRLASPSDTELRLTRRSKIKEIKYKKVKECTDIECSICLDTIKVGEFEKKLVCNHCFHKKCIDRWFKKDNDSCPMCRLKIIQI
jgi:hypothetical protein